MPFFVTKKNKGHEYLYIRVNAKIDGVSRCIFQKYVGTAKRLLKILNGEVKVKKREKIKVKEFGSLWLINELMLFVSISEIVDKHIPRGKQEKTPTIGEYFAYTIMNNMIEPVSKKALSEWYEKTAIQFVRPTEIKKLSSKKYWAKWNKVDEATLKEIAKEFFTKTSELFEKTKSLVIFDTSNYYTYMSSKTKSEIAKRGHNKEGKHHLRQIGCAIMISNETKLPLFYKEYPGNVHDSKEFEALMDEMFGNLIGINKNNTEITVVIDKGMNSEKNINWIDNEGFHFITCYSTYFAKDLAIQDIKNFKAVNISIKSKNKETKKTENILAYRTTGTYWKKERTVVVSFNPSSYRKKCYKLEEKLEKLKNHLLQLKEKISSSKFKSRKINQIIKNYEDICKNMHIKPEFYKLDFIKDSNDMIKLDFVLLNDVVDNEKASFGKNIIITDHFDWSTEKIIESSINRWKIEKCFKDTKSRKNLSVYPIRHWTDSKIRCHLFSCVVALTYLNMLDLLLSTKNIKMNAAKAIKILRNLHLVLNIVSLKKADFNIEFPDEDQKTLLKAFNFKGLRKMGTTS